MNPLGIVTATLLLSWSSPLLAPRVKNPGYPYSLLSWAAQAQTAQNSQAQARRLYEQGVKQFRNEQYQAALRTYQQVLAIESELGNNTGVGRTLNSIGGVYYERSQPQLALEVYQGSLAIRRSVGDKAGEARTLYNIGLVYQNLLQYPKAQKSFEQALKIFRQYGDRTGIEATLEALSATRPRFESGIISGTILLDDYDALGTTLPVGADSGEGSTLPEEDDFKGF